VHHSRNDQSFITFTGLDCSTFEYILDKFRPLYHRYSPYSVNGKIVRLNPVFVNVGDNVLDMFA
jgi:hypothetical protein